MFNDTAREHAAGIAIVDGEDRITYSELACRRDRVASLLSGIGVTAGDRVGVSLPNSWEFAASFLAAARIQADWIPFHTGWKSPEVEWLAERLPLAVLITTTSLSRVWECVHRGRPARIVLVDDPQNPFLRSETKGPPADAVRDPMVNYITSGSTGYPRIVPRTDSQIAAGLTDVAIALGLRPGMRWLSVVPFHHGHGLNTLFLQPLTSAATMVVMREFSAAWFVEILSRERIQVFSGSPFHFAMLTECGAQPESFTSIEICLSGGAPMAPAVTRRCRAQLGLRVRQYYGASETGPIAFAGPQDGGREDAPMYPVRGMEVRIVDEDRKPVKSGVVGRVEIGGPAIFKGYLGEDDLSASVLRDGFFLTGDLGIMDERGGFLLRGRANLVINAAGLKVDPVEVENAIRELTEVQDCCVRGFLDERQGEIVEAVIAVRPGIELRRETVIAHCRRLLAEYKVPRRIEMVESVPVDAAERGGIHYVPNIRFRKFVENFGGLRTPENRGLSRAAGSTLDRMPSSLAAADGPSHDSRATLVLS